MFQVHKKQLVQHKRANCFSENETNRWRYLLLIRSLASLIFLLLRKAVKSKNNSPIRFPCLSSNPKNCIHCTVVLLPLASSLVVVWRHTYY